ncbi:MAG: indole-3-glycerol phosphate synthase TrpC [Acidimicrobiales bacterium]
MATYLDAILARHREAMATDGRDIDALVSDASAMAPAREFASALSTSDRLAVIAEIKRRSPSKGKLTERLDPVELGLTYVEGGAACLSVLTDVEFFDGSVDDLRLTRAAVGVPVLRKDFTVGPLDVCDTRLMGADCVLLIAAALSEQELVELHELARRIGLDALVEIHDETELEMALRAGASLIGVNQRDLVTFEVDTKRAERMAAQVPDGVVRVAESGIRGADDARRLAAAGYHAVLVGEHLVTAPHPAAALAALRVPRA